MTAHCLFRISMAWERGMPEAGEVRTVEYMMRPW